ncbi:MAG: acyl-CoA/acyl-ACP dehydrogenase [Desulfurococcales archaeon]|nr:acyl-CoA/acyl-ACP dehydrogenase [Desulfurococcales archaeon]
MSSLIHTARCLDEVLGLISVLRETAEIIDKDNLIPEHVVRTMREEGVFDLRNESLGSFLCKIRAIASVSPAVAHTLLVHASAWLSANMPDLEDGQILALSVTEPGGGTDIKSSLKSTVESVDGELKLSGTKIFTSNAPYADAFVVLAHGPAGPTLYLVPKSSSVEYELLDITGLRGTGASIVRYKSAPARRVGMPGKGVREALRGINLGRLGYGAIALGIIDASLDIIVSTGREKVIFGRELLTYQGIKWTIADLHSRMRAIEALIESVVRGAENTWSIDPEIAAIVKVLGARAAQDAAWAATQILGGRGLARWSITDRLQRDARALDIGEGAREVLLDYISSVAIKSRTG